MKIFNSVKKSAAKNWLQLVIKNETDPAEILMYEPIGKDPWGDSGISSKDFKSILDQVQPRGRDLNIRINSKGGDVHEGFAIKNMLDEYPGRVVCTIDGVAASTASWMCLGADEVRASKNSQIFTHDAIAFGFGNAEDLRKTADDLDLTSDQIAGIYSDKTGKGVRTMRQMMKDETLMTGEQAMELGLVDTLTSDKAIHNFTADELEKMKAKLAAYRNSASSKGAANQQNQKETEMKKRLIALLNKHGVNQISGITISAEMTDAQLNAVNEEQLEAALAKVMEKQPAVLNEVSKADYEALKTQIAGLTETNNAQKKLRIANEVDALVASDQLPAALKEKAVARAMADETYLNELKSLPPNKPGGAPVGVSEVEITSDSFNDIQNFVLNNGPRFRNKFIGGNAGNNTVDDEVKRDFSRKGFLVANVIKKNKEKILTAWNANAIDAALQRQVILQDMIEEFSTVLLNLNVFATVYNNIPLEGTDKVEIPFFPLQTNAATTFDKAVGYTTTQDWTENSREISVGGDGVTATSGANATAGTARDRKFLGIKFTSYDLRRQPYLNLQKLFIQAANKLGVDIFTDIISRVVTVGNFAASVKAVPAAAFSGDDVADLRQSATGRMWPISARALVLDHTYFTPLLKDPTFKSAQNFGNSEAIQFGRIANIYGFESINEVPSLTTYSPAGENLVGWINHKSAVGVATSPIMPTPEVRMLMTQFDVVVDPKTGVAFSYRKFGNVTTDTTSEFIECAYGANKFIASALARMTSQ